MVIRGNTYRLKGVFKNKDGDFVDPTSVTVIIYGQGQQKLNEFTPMRSSTGKYYIDLTLNETDCIGFFEFKGLINSMPYLMRKQFNYVYSW